MNTINLQSLDDTLEFGRKLGENCRGGEVFLLFGDLGAGKTSLTQGLAIGLGVPKSVAVTSPTFVIHSQYQGRFELNHFDLYRVGEAGDLLDLGFDDFFGDRTCVCAIEWPEFLGRITPIPHIRVDLAIAGNNSRDVTVSFGGDGSLERAFVEIFNKEL